MFNWFFKNDIARNPITGFPIPNKEIKSLNKRGLVGILTALLAVSFTVWKANGK